jgi:hypothetical protein
MEIPQNGYSAACGNQGFLHCVKGAARDGLPKMNLARVERGFFSQEKDYIGNLNTCLCNHHQGDQNNV